MKIKQILFSFIALASLMPAFGQEKENDHTFNLAKNIDVFTAICKNLDLMYVDTLNADDVVGYGIDAMLSSLDPYTVYYPESKMKDLDMMITGKYAGIGAIIKYNLSLDRVVINEPYEGMPAAEVGLKKGDIILQIDDSTCVGKDVNWVSSHLRGEAGTSFMLKIKRPSTGKTMKMKITRRAIQLPAVPYYGLQPNGIGYLNLSSFTEGSSKDFRRAFIEMRNAGMKSFVLDLRNNGGGALEEATNIVNMFVPKGITLVKTRGKLQRTNRDYTTTVEPIDTVMPMVVLVNENTASASEITSGSLQDLDRAVVLGTRTYGKGLVQVPVELPYNGSLKLTTSKYYIPSGRCIQAINYKHARGGYTEHVPDSLTKEFHTLGGRVVRDGGGIKPDVEVKPDSLPNIAYYLSSGVNDSTEVLFNYELNYIKNHPTVAPASTFELSDQDYEDFKQAVIKSGFKYDRESEKYLKNLIKLAKFEGYYDDAKAEFDALQKKLQHNLAKDLDYNKTLLKQIIASDLMTAYYYQRGALQNELRYDKQYKAAVDLLSDSERYHNILSPKSKSE